MVWNPSEHSVTDQQTDDVHKWIRTSCRPPRAKPVHKARCKYGNPVLKSLARSSDTLPISTLFAINSPLWLLQPPKNREKPSPSVVCTLFSAVIPVEPFYCREGPYVVLTSIISESKSWLLQRVTLWWPGSVSLTQRVRLWKCVCVCVCVCVSVSVCVRHVMVCDCTIRRGGDDT